MTTHRPYNDLILGREKIDQHNKKSQRHSALIVTTWHAIAHHIQNLSLRSFKLLQNRILTIAIGSDAPIVERKCDRHGQLSYTIYDPKTKQRKTCSSDKEVRAWLDQRYYL